MHLPHFDIRKALIGLATASYVFVGCTLLLLQAAPGSWFMQVRVFVPDHYLGDVPKVLYERTITRTKRKVWEVFVNPTMIPSAEVTEIKNPKLKRKVCGSGEALYRAMQRETLDNDLVWFMGSEDCVPKKPGVYELDVCYHWTIWIFGKTYCAPKTVFAVAERPLGK